MTKRKKINKKLKVGATKNIRGILYRLNKSHRWERCPGGKIRSQGQGRGFGIGRGRGPIGRMR